VRICFFGDSFVNGTGDPDCLGWTGRVCARARRRGHDLTHYNLGVRRDTSADVRARWRAEAARRLPAGVDGRCVFSFGANDCVAEAGGPRVPMERALENAAAILAEAAPAMPVLFVGPPPLDDAAANGRIARLSAGLAEHCQSLGVPYLETFAPLAGSAVWRAEATAGDGAHPGAAGYELLAEMVAAWPAWRAWFGR
jgi:lysophospholipase L1-like esterase